jgi:hypothetical protein
MWTLRATQPASTRHRSTATAALLQLPTLALALALVCLPCLPWVHTARAASVRAHVAHTLNVTDVAHLHLLRGAGELIEEEGPATGALPGKVKARIDVSTSVTGTFVFYARGGSITGHGSARLHSTGTYASFGGSLVVSHGTGRYTQAHGSGGLYGTVNRRTDALVIQTTGKLTY